MAAAWVKSLQCKSRAFDDVVHPSPKQPLISPALGNAATSCRNSFQGLKDVIPSKSHPKPVTKSKKVKPKHKPLSEPPPLKPVKRHPQSAPQQSQVRRRQQHSHSESKTQSIKQTTTSASIRPVIHLQDPFFPSLSELQEGHPSRNVVEIIFQTRWSSIKPFPGQVEMVFKIHNLPKTVTRFEEYRETVKIRADSEVVGDNNNNNNNSSTSSSGRKHNKQYCSEENAVRCVADGNEMMRFHCLGPTTGVIDAGAGGICAINAAGKVGGVNHNNNNNDEKAVATSICTFDGSGTAHDNAGGGRGRRAMLVCRVIAGRVKRRRVGMGMVALTGGGFESVAGENGELLVFDSRAVLPCFLVIYRL